MNLLEKQVLDVQKKWKTPLCIDLWCGFHCRVADIKFAESQDRLRPFSSLIIIFSLRIFRRSFFLRRDIAYTNAFKPWNSKYHKSWPNSRVTKNGKFIMWYRARVVVVPSRFFEGRYFEMPSFLKCSPHPIFLGTLWTTKNNRKKKLISFIPYELCYSVRHPDYLKEGPKL